MFYSSQNKRIKSNNKLRQRFIEITLIITTFFSLFLLLSLFTYNAQDPSWSHVTSHKKEIMNVAGYAGAWISDVFLCSIGFVAYLFPFLLFYLVLFIFYLRKEDNAQMRMHFILRCIGFVIFFISSSSIIDLNLNLSYLPFGGGGAIGDLFSGLLLHLLSVVGVNLLLFMLLLISLTLVCGISWIEIAEWLGKMLIKFVDYLGMRILKIKWVDNIRTIFVKISLSFRFLSRMKRKKADAEVTSNDLNIKSNIRDKLNFGNCNFLGEASNCAVLDAKSGIDVDLSGNYDFVCAANTVNGNESFDFMLERNQPSKTGASVVSGGLIEQQVIRAEIDGNVQKHHDDYESFVMNLQKAKEDFSLNNQNTAEPNIPDINPQDQVEEVLDGLIKQIPFSLPQLSLLDLPERHVANVWDKEQLAKMSREVELRLQDFNIEAKVVAVHPGPVITRFEIQLAAGTKVGKITALVKDLARSLSVISVRIVEVIPGKSVIGLELPNERREIVRLREILSSHQYESARAPLIMALGKDISGHPVVVDLAKMPHLLVAGTTGSGKSVCLNAILLSFLYKYSPQEVRLILIDPKMLELSIYDGVPHLLAPVVTDMKDAALALRWCVMEMERRYKLLSALGVRNMHGYNHRVKEAKENGDPLLDPLWRANPSAPNEGPKELSELPYIVVLADEYADMIMVVGKKVEELIVRIAQKARAAGIHLILATQRPSVDVITGIIKANIPTRIALQVSSKIDSRTILDQSGAEQLLGFGDMLYLPPGSGVPIRVHGAFVDDDEVHRVVKDLKKHASPEYVEEIFAEDCSANSNVSGNDISFGGASGSSNYGDLAEYCDDAEKDPLYDQAVKIVLETRRASISQIQRRLRIGYNRAARMVEGMEHAGLVGPMETNGNRDVLVPKREDE